MTLVYAKKKKKSTHPEKTHKKHSSPSKKSEPQTKSTMVLLKALTTIPGITKYKKDTLINTHSTSCEHCMKELPFSNEIGKFLQSYLI